MSEYVRHLFIVRVWLEAGDAGRAAQWRGSAEHTRSGQRLYFTSLEDLVDFITLRRGEPPNYPDDEIPDNHQERNI